MEQKLSLEALTLADIQPSQFYISGEKPRRTCAILNPARCMNSRGKPCSPTVTPGPLRPTERRHYLCNDA